MDHKELESKDRVAMRLLGQTGLNIQCCVLTGSRMFGIENEASDYDYRAFYKPTLLQLVRGDKLGSHKLEDKENNVEVELKPITDLIRLVEVSDVNLIDMVFSRHVVFATPLWESICSNRFGMLAKEMQGFFGHIVEHTDRFTARKERMALCEEIMAIEDKGQSLDETPEFINLMISGNPLTGFKNSVIRQKRMYVVLDKQYNIGSAFSQVQKSIGSKLERYKRNIKQKDGFNFKHMSHCLRVMLEYLEIVQTGNLIFPTKHAEILKDIKAGEYEVEHVVELINRNYEKAMKANINNEVLNETADVDFFTDIVVRAIKLE